MKNVSEIYGIAGLGDNLRAARVENDGARLKVTSLLTFDDNLNAQTLESGRLIFNVDQKQAVVKKLKIRQSSFMEPAEIVQFEMSQSLLEPSDQFYFDSFPLGSVNGYKNYLSIAYRKSEIDKLMMTYQNHLRKPSGYKLDAVALADGYLTFCRPEQGDLQILADIGTDRVVLAFIYGGKLHATGRVETAPGAEVTKKSAAFLASEFKIILSYRLAELFQDGITVPSSRIILSGRHAGNETLISALKDLISTEITYPVIHGGYFRPSSTTTDRHKPEQFLIPLGLAVE